MPATAATVIATFSRRMAVRLDDGTHVEARIKGKKLRPVCGDQVDVVAIPGESDWLITGVHKRRNELSRPNLRGKTEILAANLDLLVVVAATTPEPDWFIVDRYLCAAEVMEVDAAVVFNKSDLSLAEKHSAALSTYAGLGYETLSCSASTGENIEALERLLTQGIAILVGQSGVGKSSLINRLADDPELATFEVSEKTGEGRHTTVNSRMISLQHGGAVIDSPGVRDYAPALQSSQQAIIGFREVNQLGQQCRFANCRHLREPDCAVKQGVEDGQVDPRRYESYKRTYSLTERLTSA